MKNKSLYQNWVEGDGLEQICQWVRLGMTDKQIAQNIGITTVTLYDWKRRFPTFAEAMNKAKTSLQLELEKSMQDLAMGKAYAEEVKTILDPNSGKVVRVEKIRKQVPPNANLLMFLAKNLMPKKYHPPLWDNEEIVSNTGGGKLCRIEQSVRAAIEVARG